MQTTNLSLRFTNPSATSSDFCRDYTEPSAPFYPHDWFRLKVACGITCIVMHYSECVVLFSFPCFSSASFSIAWKVPVKMCSMAAVYCIRWADVLWLFISWQWILTVLQPMHPWGKESRWHTVGLKSPNHYWQPRWNSHWLLSKAALWLHESPKPLI